MTPADPLPKTVSPTATAEADTRPRLSTQELFARTRKLAIEHEGQVYTLQLTRQNRLLLTK